MNFRILQVFYDKDNQYDLYPSRQQMQISEEPVTTVYKSDNV